MSKILKFIDNHLGYFIVIPALLFIVIFSLIPIVQSIRYSFFDYQLNDQQKNSMYLTRHYNLDLANEDIFYLNYYLSDEINNVTEDTTKQEIQDEITSINDGYNHIIGQFDVTEGVVVISTKQYNEIGDFNEQVIKAVGTIYSIEGESFEIKDDTIAVSNDLNNTVVDNNYIGLQNYETAFHDSRMYSTLKITLIFTFFSVLLEFIFGMSLALIMNKSIRGKGLIRTTSLIPWAIPTSVAALMWLYLFNGDSGIIALVLDKLHIIGKPSALLGSGQNALISVIAADVWKTTPYMALLLLAGLQVIPKDLYESSSIDGANKIQQFYKITLPLLKPSILVALLFRTLDAFRVFDLIYVLTGGGPGGETESISIYSYKVMKSQTILGYGSTLVIIMAVVVGIISFIYIKVLGVKLASDN